MNKKNFLSQFTARAPHWRRRSLDAARTLVLGSALGVMLSAGAATKLADQPLFAANDVPGNLALPLSVEFPTAISVAHIGSTYAATNRYLGYFDPEKCYVYQYDAVNADQRNSYFIPNGSVATPGDRRCNTTATNQWSGNFLNWASMQTIDPFRWALTGGYRYIDEVGETVLEKAWASQQGGAANFPNRSLGTATLTSGATPFNWGAFNLRIGSLGNKMRFTQTGALGQPHTAPPAGVESFGLVVASAMDSAKVHDLFVRVRVCDKSSGAGPVESNCVDYKSGYAKPEGLMQQYAMKLRYSALGYLNDNALSRDGGVLRARMKFVGPSEPVPGKPETTNAMSEWDADTGVFSRNPDKGDADATAAEFGVAVEDSGVLNYLNKFGSITKESTYTYKTYDPVGELYYAAIRYFKNQGNVPQWSAKSATAATNKTWVDGFPVITTWDDPIKYACQKNFILGIGDVNTHADRNLPGSTVRKSEPTMPLPVSGDATVNAQTATTNVGKREGLPGDLGLASPYGGCCSNNGALMAGLAFDSHTLDIRPDLPDNGDRFQSISTYWLDVLEFSAYKNNNQFYLAAKYGGFNVPNGFKPYANADPLDKALWTTNGQKVGTNDRPDNYFVASSPDTMVAGLTKAFAKLASELQAYTTSFSTSLPQVANSGNKSYSAEYDAKFWTGELKASELSFTGEGEPSLVQKWRGTDKLAAQLAGTGWDLKRNVASWDPVAKTGVRFRASGAGSLGAIEAATLDTTLHPTDDRTDFLNYLRGDRKYEAGSTAVVADPTKQVYRPRDKLLGDIVGSRAVPVAPPNLPMSDSYNPGYAAFKTLKKDRPTLLFAGANDGMMHAFNGALDGADAGKEIFAYVPSALFSGPDATPAISGLAALGDPNYAHRFYVNASPAVFDVDFAKTDGATGAADWRSILVGGLGKGGRSYYAIDVTDAHLLDTEAKVAASVLWEFSDPDLGFSFGEPVMIKTKAYGWTLIIPSGYNNPDGKGYIFLINPKTGALLQKISTGVGGGTLGDAGLAHIEAFINDYADGHADAVYGGDLLGNLWRFDIRGSTFPAPQLLAELRDASDKPQPVTSRPLIEVFPKTNIRFVKVGTGQLLSDEDIASAQEQTYYSIRDGNNGTFTEATDLPTGVTFPLRRDADLLPNTDLFAGITADPDAPMGWYLDLGIDSATSIAWRVVSDSDSFRNAVSFAPTLPNGDACKPSGSSRVYIVDFASGKTLVQEGSTLKAYWSDIAGVVTDLRFLSVAGQARLIGGSDSGQIRKVPGSFGSTLDFRRVNWRELPTAD